MLPTDKNACIQIVNEKEVSVNGTKYEVNLYYSVHSNVYITTDKSYVFKHVTAYLEYDVFEREVFLLEYLKKNNCDFVPELIKYDITNKIIMMSYCGSRLSEKTPDILVQMKNIESTLKRHNVKHNDVKERANSELLILNEKLYLCDFGWGSIGTDHGCNIGLWSGQKPGGYVNYGFNPPNFTWDNNNKELWYTTNEYSV
jgi:tRNA A-37 threonylcarbamoyl transferase component Bud32